MSLILLATLVAGSAPPPRCVVQQVHTPAGKLVQNAPLLRCDKQEGKTERRSTRRSGDAR